MNDSRCQRSVSEDVVVAAADPAAVVVAAEALNRGPRTRATAGRPRPHGRRTATSRRRVSAPTVALVPALRHPLPSNSLVVRVSHESHSYSQNGILRFQVHLVDLLYQRRLVIGEVAAFRRRARRSASICGRSTHPTPGGDRGRRFDGVVWSALCGFWICPPRAHLRWTSLGAAGRRHRARGGILPRRRRAAALCASDGD